MATSDILARVKTSGRVTADDALAVRRAVYGSDGEISMGEITAMLDIDAVAKDADPTWTALVSEAGADFLVHQEHPQGYLSAANANWLVPRIATDGVVNTPRMLELLVHCLDQAESAPAMLSALALSQVKLAVTEGRGPLAGTSKPGVIGPAEVAMLRRILYAAGGAAGISITRAEAEVLFDLNDAVAGAANDAAWNDLFTKAIANFMMAANAWVPPSPEQAKARDAWLDAPTPSIGRFMLNMVTGRMGSLPDNAEQEIAAHNAEKAADIASAEVITGGEAEWLADRIGRNGALQENEKAVLRFIRDEAPKIHPSLAALIAKAA